MTRAITTPCHSHEGLSPKWESSLTTGSPAALMLAEDDRLEIEGCHE